MPSPSAPIRYSAASLLTVSICLPYNARAQTFSEVPEDLFQVDVSPELLQTVKRELPEARATDSAFLNPAYNPNLYLSEDAQVTLTFLDEGAGYRNSLGYFAYDPAVIDGLTHGDVNTSGYGGVSIAELLALDGVEIGMVFPNASWAGGGGQLQPGDSLQLGGGQVFDQGTHIGFFLLQNAWRGGQVRGYSDGAPGALTFYTVDMLNPENTPDATLDTPSDQVHSRHVAMLFGGQDREALVMSFEDLKRTNSQGVPPGVSDEDFNDAVFMITSNPVQAIANTPAPVAPLAVPDRPYGVFNVEVCQDSANAIEQYLPERTNVNAEFLNPAYDPNLVIGEATQVAVTFNDEGASYQNSLGYFVFNDNTFANLAHGDIDTDGVAGVSLDELSEIDGVEVGLVFGKAAAVGKGGSLIHGDSVLLDDGRLFEPGDRIGFFLVQAGWDGDHVRGYDGDSDNPLVFYSLDLLNPETALDGDSGRHIAMLFANENRESIVMGFEDLHRLDAGLNEFGYASDEDFNDNIFCVWSIQSQALSGTSVFVASNASVPEPASVALICAGACFAVPRRRRPA